MLVVNTINTVSAEELERDAREVFGETEEGMTRDLADIKTWIRDTAHMRNVRQDDSFLRLFLRGCNYNVKETKEKLDMYFCVRSLLPKWFDNWDPSEPNLQKIIEAGVFLPLQGFDKLGRYSILVRMGKVIPATMTAEDCYKVLIMIFNMVIEGNIQSQTKGMAIVMDLDGMGTSHSSLINPSLVKKLLVVFQEAFPMDNDILLELSSIYFLNMPKILEKLIMVVLSFLKKYKSIVKIQDRESGPMVEEMGTEILPAEYGGDNRDCEQLARFWEEELGRQKEWLSAQRNFKTDESLRVGKSKLERSCSVM